MSAAGIPDWLLMAALRAYAEAETEGRTLSKTGLMAAVSCFSGSETRAVREALVRQGLLTVAGASVANVTPAGWNKVGLPPPTPNPRGPRQRACLRCRKPFRSAGAHNRLCDPCRRIPDPGVGFCF